MKRFAIGDIHGSYKALMQVLKKSGFNYQEDMLIVLGDVCDGWSEVKECILELSKIKNLIFIIGNHDQWAIDFTKTGLAPNIWVSQGGKSTLQSFTRATIEEQKQIDKFFSWGIYYYELDNMLFVHGGIDPYKPIREQNVSNMMWDGTDRDMFKKVFSLEKKYNPNRDTYVKVSDVYEEIYIGHTSIWKWSKFPWRLCNVFCMDTGAGFEGVLSMMDIDSKEVFQSDRSAELYPNEYGRR